jgi:hypothetical protein
LEDLGFQYDFISYLDVEEEMVKLNQMFKVIILPKVVCLSDKEAKALREFVYEGGILIADYLCGLMDQHGRGRERGILDDLFGIVRNESSGYMNGRGLTEIDGEKYQKPFLDRFTNYEGAYRYEGIVVFERGTKHQPGCKATEIKKFLGQIHQSSVLIENQFGKGRTFYLNLSPLEYWAPDKRFSNLGKNFRKIVSDIMHTARLFPTLRIYEGDHIINMIEPLYWRNGNKSYIGLIKNPTEEKELPRLGNSLEIQGITGQEVQIRLEFKDPVLGLINLRTENKFGPGRIFHDRFKPWEGNLYEVIR